MKQLKYGILSTSSIAPRFIAAVRAAKAGTVVAVSSRSEEKAREKADLWQIPKAYGSHEALLEDKEVNVVYISNVNSQHYPWAKAALLAGKNVVCEKPCTTTQAHTRELFALAREKGLFFMEAEKMLFLPALLEVKKRIERGDLGEITMAQMSHSFSAGYNDWMFDKEAGGGPLLSSGIYAIELILWLFCEIKEIGGVCSQKENGMPWQYVISGVTASGVLFSAANSTSGKLENTAVISGTKGYVQIPNYWKATTANFHIEGEEIQSVAFPCQYELMYETTHIKDCFEKGLLTSPVVTEEISAQGIATLEKLIKLWEA